MISFLYFLFSSKFIQISANEDVFLSNMFDHIQQLNPYQITVFRNTSVICAKEENDVLKHTISSTPTAVIDVKIANTTGVNLLSTMKAFVYPRTSTVYVALLTRVKYTENIHLREFQILLELLINLSPRTTRPKCLLVYTRPDSIADEKLIQAILDYAWYQKFLDFSIIKRRLRSYEKTIITTDVYHYNPFSKSHTREPYTSSTKLFPDKLKDMRGYELKVPFFNMPPYMIARKVAGGQLTYEGTGLMFMEHVGKILNFSVRVVDEAIVPKDSYNSHTFTLSQLEIIKHVAKSLRDNQFNLLPVPLYSNDFKLTGEDIERGLPFATDQMGFLIRNVALLEAEYGIGPITYFAVSCCTVLVFIVVVRCMRFGDRHFGYFAVVSLTLGQNTRQPERSSERIVFFCIVFLSLTYFSNIFATITETRVNAHEPTLSTAEDVEKSKLQPHINQRIYSAYFEDSNETLKSKFTRVKVTNDCVQSLVEGNDFACFTTSSGASIFVRETIKPNRCPRLVFCKYEFFTIGGNLFYEKASPYVERFDRVVRQFIGAGIISKWKEYHESKKITCPEDIATHVNSYKHRNLINKLLIILSVGVTIAVVTFVFEFLFYSCKTR